MPARVLLIADPKMLPALAAGLREGGRFEVVTAPSPEAAQELAAEPLQAAILFYGTPLWTLPAALQALKPLRDKGAHVVAVLQKAQVGLRDECFRAGASDAFFMPIPKEQFVCRLSASLGLAYGESDGLPASVQVASRSTPAGMPAATVTTAGVHGDASIPFEAGHTVRLSWKANEEAFASWGLVVRSAPAQVRFAGLTPEEDSRLRSWLKASLPASGAAVSTASMPTPTPPEGSTPAGGSAIIIPPSAPPVQVAALAEAGPNLEGAAPSAGLPRPGEAASSPSTAAPSAAPLGNLFDEQGAPSTRAQAVAVSEPFSLGTPWPEPWPVEWCRGAAAALLRSQPVPTGPSGGEAVARKVLLKVTPSERAMAERPGEAGHSAVADAWMARIALAGAEVDGEKLAAAGSTVLVDGDAVAALAKLVDGAGERLQQEANKFIAKGDTESLRVLTGARSALTQELLAFKKLADRLRGLGAAPALGPGGLDPDVQLAGRTAAKTRTPAIGVSAVKRAEFSGFDQKPKKKRTPLIVGLLAVLFVAGLLNVAYFSRVRSTEARPGEMDKAGHGIIRIAISGKRALVQVTPLWAEHPAENWRPLAAALGQMGVEQAVVQLADGKPLGAIDVVENKPFLVTGVKPTPAAPPAPAQGATPGAVPATDKHAPKADEPKADAGTAKK